MADRTDGDEKQPRNEDDRLAAVEAHQEATDTKVDGLIARIDQVLGGGKDVERQAHAQAQDKVEGKLEDPAHLNAIRQAIRDVHAEESREQADAAHAAEHARLSSQPQGKAEPEHQPREAMKTWKEKLQGAMFGAER